MVSCSNGRLHDLSSWLAPGSPRHRKAFETQQHLDAVLASPPRLRIHETPLTAAQPCQKPEERHGGDVAPNTSTGHAELYCANPNSDAAAAQCTTIPYSCRQSIDEGTQYSPRFQDFSSVGLDARSDRLVYLSPQLQVRGVRAEGPHVGTAEFPSDSCRNGSGEHDGGRPQEKQNENQPQPEKSRPGRITQSSSCLRDDKCDPSRSASRQTGRIDGPEDRLDRQGGRRRGNTSTQNCRRHPMPVNEIEQHGKLERSYTAPSTHEELPSSQMGNGRRHLLRDASQGSPFTSEHQHYSDSSVASVEVTPPKGQHPCHGLCGIVATPTAQQVDELLQSLPLTPHMIPWEEPSSHVRKRSSLHHTAAGQRSSAARDRRRVDSSVHFAVPETTETIFSVEERSPRQSGRSFSSSSSSYAGARGSPPHARHVVVGYPSKSPHVRHASQETPPSPPLPSSFSSSPQGTIPPRSLTHGAFDTRESVANRSQSVRGDVSTASPSAVDERTHVQPSSGGGHVSETSSSSRPSSGSHGSFRCSLNERVFPSQAPPRVSDSRQNSARNTSDPVASRRSSPRSEATTTQPSTSCETTKDPSVVVVRSAKSWSYSTTAPAPNATTTQHEFNDLLPIGSLAQAGGGHRFAPADVAPPSPPVPSFENAAAPPPVRTVDDDVTLSGEQYKALLEYAAKATQLSCQLNASNQVVRHLEASLSESARQCTLLALQCEHLARDNSALKESLDEAKVTIQMQNRAFVPLLNKVSNDEGVVSNNIQVLQEKYDALQKTARESTVKCEKMEADNQELWLRNFTLQRIVDNDHLHDHLSKQEIKHAKAVLHHARNNLIGPSLTQLAR